MDSLRKQIDVVPAKVPVFTPKPQRGPPGKQVTITRPHIPGTFNPPSTSSQGNPATGNAYSTPLPPRSPMAHDRGMEGVRMDKYLALMQRQTNYMGEISRYLKVISETSKGKVFIMTIKLNTFI